MKISAKTRYALAATTLMAGEYSKMQCITIIALSEKLKISKIYLEQVFSLLKRGKIVKSIKGSQGGYLLANAPDQISIYQIFASIETSLFSQSEQTVEKSAPNIEKAMHESVFEQLDMVIEEKLKSISLHTILQQVKKYDTDPQNYMYYL